MNTSTKNSNLSYKDAGVNIDAGNEFVGKIKSLTRSTHRSEVMGNIGGFGGLFSLAQKKLNKPILVSGTDGVGTKLKLAQQMQKHDTIGIDLVAMCVNDIVVTGAEPLFFLDYYATGKLNPDFATQIVAGIAEGCRQAGAALIGGETAEMPGMYQGEDYDLAGFAVGLVDEDDLIDGSNIKIGDVLLALPSSGPHSNGYSLIRKILDISNANLNDPFADSTLGKALITPTRIYVKTILTLLKSHTLHGLAHITGGGLLENIPRILPEHTNAEIDLTSWQWPEIFSWLQQQGNIEQTEMLRTFNCGIGMVLIVPKEEVEEIQNCLAGLKEPHFTIGKVTASKNSQPEVIIKSS